MDVAETYVVVDGRLTALVPTTTIPPELLGPLGSEIDSLLGQPALTIGAWEQSERGPLVLALTSTGQLVVVVAANRSDVASISKTILAIDSWLATMDLRALGELSGDRVAFYEGLLELSPDSSISVATVRRYLLVSAIDSVDLASVMAAVPEAVVEVRYFDVLHAPGGPALLTLRETSHETKLGPASRIDLTGRTAAPAELENVSRASAEAPLVAGRAYPVETLPELFAPFGDGLRPLTDALFVIESSIVVVINVPERRRDTPIESADKIRWDTDATHVDHFDAHRTNVDGTARSVHIFLESNQDDRAVYLGTGVPIESRSRTEDHKATMWFRIDPPLDPELFRLIRKGRLPLYGSRSASPTRQLRPKNESNP